jgi:hypothetical protein
MRQSLWGAYEPSWIYLVKISVNSNTSINIRDLYGVDEKMYLMENTEEEWEFKRKVFSWTIAPKKQSCQYKSVYAECQWLNY